jgi:hypothetical protein
MALPDLDELIAEVDRTCASTDWIDRLATAAELATQLQALGDDLVTEFVEHARFASRSWAEIGAALGVTRQAAQQRFVAPHREYSDDQFSEELRRAMPLIKQVAVTYRHNYIGTEHVLLGIIRESNTATALLEASGVDVGAVREAIERKLEPGASHAGERIAWTPYARRSIALASEAAREAGANQIGCDHVVAGLVRVGRGGAAGLLRDAGIANNR